MNTEDKLSQFADNTRCLLNTLPGLIFIKDLKFNYVECSKDCNDFWIKLDEKSFLGRSDYDLPWDSCAELYQQSDQEVLTGKPLSLLEPMPIQKNNILTIKTLKRPIQDHVGDIIGILGQVTILPAKNSLGDIMSLISHEDKKNTALSNTAPQNYKIQSYDDDIKLTQRETECLFLLIRGKSAKEIAQFLGLSYRTIEEHIAHIKYKMGVSTRSQIFSRAIELGMLEIIPKSNVLMSLYKNFNKWKDFFSA